MTEVRVEVAYFAQARELAGVREEQFVLKSPANVEGLFSEIVTVHPKIQEIREDLTTLINGRAVSANVELKDGDRMALLPPIAGG